MRSTRYGARSNFVTRYTVQEFVQDPEVRGVGVWWRSSWWWCCCCWWPTLLDDGDVLRCRLSCTTMTTSSCTTRMIGTSSHTRRRYAAGCNAKPKCHTHTRTHTHLARTHTHTHTRTRARTRTRAYMHTRARARTRAHTYTHAHTRAHTHTLPTADSVEWRQKS